MSSAAVVIGALRVKSAKKGNDEVLKHFLAKPVEKIKKKERKKQKHKNSGEDTKRHKTR